VVNQTYATPTSGAATGTASQSPVPSPTRTGTGPKSWTRGLTTPPARRDVDDDAPEPRLRQLMGVCAWAAVLGGIGLVVGVRGLIGVLTANPPGWYEPAVSVVGLTGIALTVAAFLTVQRRSLPFALLGAATAVLAVALILTANAF
jgi:hypothetical protein